MRKVLLSLAAGVSLALAASSVAADGMHHDSVKDAGCALPFAGFYVGGHGGFAQFTSHQNDQNGYLTDNSGWSATEDKFTGGVQAGYNWQKSCHVLFGVEADWSWGNVDAATVNEPGGLTVGTMTTSIKSYGTLRTRTGLVHDNLLLYLTGGLAFAAMDFTVTETTSSFSFSDTRWGWTAGVGSEWALRKNVTFKSEIVYMNFGDNHYAFIDDDPFNFSTQDSMWVGRAGVNVRF
jgi:outer membrane immunogenic protein